MKLKLSIVLLVTALAGAVGFLMGTAGGRQRRDAVVARVRRTRQTPADDSSDTSEMVDSVDLTIVEDTIVTAD